MYIQCILTSKGVLYNNSFCQVYTLTVCKALTLNFYILTGNGALDSTHQDGFAAHSQGAPWHEVAGSDGGHSVSCLLPYTCTADTGHCTLSTALLPDAPSHRHQCTRWQRVFMHIKSILMNSVCTLMITKTACLKNLAVQVPGSLHHIPARPQMVLVCPCLFCVHNLTYLSSETSEPLLNALFLLLTSQQEQSHTLQQLPGS